jgi:hypothetical protein
MHSDRVTILVTIVTRIVRELAEALQVDPADQVE